MEIVVREKPSFVSWEAVHDVLMSAHALNREKGVIMKFPTLSGEEIRQKFDGGKGKMLVAMDGEKVVGTAAFIIKQGYFWFCKEKYIYLCFAGILPEYEGKGIYKQLCQEREEAARRLGIKVMLFDTNEQNTHVIDVNIRNGFQKVSFKDYIDHYNIVLAKFLDEKKPNTFYRFIRFNERKLRVKILHLFNK